LGINRYHLIDLSEGEQFILAVSDVVKAVSGAEDFEFLMFADEVLHLLE